MPKLQFLLDKGNATFNDNNKRKRFWLLNSPRVAILDFMTSLHCHIVSNKRTSAFQQQRQCSDVIKSKMAACRKFKSRTLFPLLLLLNVTFPLSRKICNLGIICSNLVSTCANSRGSLKGLGCFSGKAMTCVICDLSFVPADVNFVLLSLLIA